MIAIGTVIYVVVIGNGEEINFVWKNLSVKFYSMEDFQGGEEVKKYLFSLLVFLF